MLIIYDVTRLVSRRRAPTPTGIDRVDFRYAKFFLDHQEYETHYILQEGGRFFVIDNKTFSLLIKTFEMRWFKKSDSTILDQAMNQGIGIFFSYVRKKLQQTNKDILNSEYNGATSYKALMEKFLNAKPKNALGGRVKWINKLPKVLKRPILFLAGNIYYLYKELRSSKFKAHKTPAQNSAIDDSLMNIIKRHRNRDIRYFNMSHHGIDNINGYADLVCAGVGKLVFCIYDLIPITFPEYVRDGDADKHSNRLKSVLSFAESEIITISEASKKEIIQFAGNYNLNIPPIHVLYIGVEEHMLAKPVDTRNKFDVYSPYFVYVSTIEPRKNHLLLLNLWRQMVEEKEELIPKLIIIGKRGWENQSVTAMLDRCTKIQNHVIEISGLDDDELIDVYRGAKALLFPSYTEGWGMPLVESLALQKPVICNNIGVFYEAGQMVPEYVDVMDSAKWKKTILDYSQTSSLLREAQVKRLEQYKYPDWTSYFDKFEIILKRGMNK
ncbi:glycosyltransferase family 4 protein [Gynuella sunshinyii]|uniref:Glycosyltransferase n=1 Tax=Gynuella sunshinyii YC6258 TaxID=1445510 RepID=A0A0C5W3Z2_9GAMM|nr:glycosyltransferase family 1 protein [Gynuella sunshinyii]AJQ97339.1 glycosyltransferase [Gynuella sunshinyii YC6258]